MEAVVLFGLWVLLSGKLSFFHLIVGGVVTSYVVWQHTRLPPSPVARKCHRRPLRAIWYGFWLFWQIMVSAVYVARVILRPWKHLDPQLIRFHSDQPSLFHAVILANSITLTPGTLTLDLEDNRFLVHALTPATAQDVLSGKMAARVARLSTDEPIPPPKQLVITKEPHVP